MTLEEVKTMLLATGLQVSYSSVPIAEAVKPYLVYWQTGANNFAADGIVYYSRKQITASLYTDLRDLASEALVESALAGIYWTKSTEYLEGEKLHETTYTFEV